MSFAFALITLLTLASAAVAMALRNIIHSALLLVASWAGIAAFYLWAGAEFVAFAQVLVYVGAVSMIVLFAVLLTQRSHDATALTSDSLARAAGGLLVGGAVAGVLFGAIISTRIEVPLPAAPVLTVHQLGGELMGPQAAALLVIGMILTVALLGAVVLAATDRDEGKDNGQ